MALKINKIELKEWVIDAEQSAELIRLTEMMD